MLSAMISLYVLKRNKTKENGRGPKSIATKKLFGGKLTAVCFFSPHLLM